MNSENSKLYFVKGSFTGADGIKVMYADGSDVETLVSTDLLSPVGMILDLPAGKLYFSDRYANNIKRANLDGTDVEVVVKDTRYPVDLLIGFETRTLYWTARDTGGVYRTGVDQNDVDGASLTPIVTGLSNPIGITMDPKKRKLYYTECFLADSSGVIWESEMDGADASKVATTSLPLGVYFVAASRRFKV
jgi:sugar lactone lactonase YvrE